MNNKQKLHHKVKQLREKRYQRALEVATTFTATGKKARQDLSGVYHRDDELIGTDAHIMIQIKNVKHNKKGTYRDGEELNVVYPIENVDKVLQRTVPMKMSISDCSVKEWLGIHQRALKFTKEQVNHPVLFDGQYFCAKRDVDYGGADVVDIKSEYFRESLKVDLDGIEVYYNSKFLVTAMEALKKLKIWTFTFEYYGQYQPIRIVAEDVLIVVLPVRTFGGKSKWVK